MSRHDDHDPSQAGFREEQERQVAFSYALTEAEHALAREACVVGRTFEEAGIFFDATTFIVMRIVEGSTAEDTDPVGALHAFGALGVLGRSVALAEELLADVA